GQRDYYTGTNVLFSHGTVDPWSYLTKQLGTEQHWSVVTVGVEGGTHCSDLKAACDGSGNCSDERQRVQTLTQHNIDRWLNGPFSAPDSISLNDNVGKRPEWYDRFVYAPLSIKQNKIFPVANNRAKRSTVFESIKKKSVFGRGSGWNQFTGKSTNYRLHLGALRDWPPNVVEGTVEQPWDHFDPTDNRRFKQRFFVNEMYAEVNA
ncbi:hypothetical protein PMAYCL1PPCAC_20195, partial [Pristionchus mayeri]